MYNLRTTLFLLFLCFSQFLFAQKGSINGCFSDENSRALEAVSITLIALPDSTITAFALSDSTGCFSCPNLKASQFRVVGHYMGYALFDTSLYLAPQQQVNLGKIPLKPTSIGLSEVEIKAKATPIIARNDTIYFHAPSFQTEKNAAVLELLKELPGIEIDDDGNIKAQGKAVLNILVDGKPFFNGDQGTTTKVLPADAIQTVEVYNQTSKEADFSGVSDGEKEKTINLILKEDRKKGWFGDISSSAGGSQINEQRHAIQFNANRFAPKYQMSITGNRGNLTGFGSTGFQRSQSLGTDLALKRNNDNATYINYNFNGISQQQKTEVSQQVLASGGGFINKEHSENQSNNHGHSVSVSTSHDRDTTRILSFNANFNVNKSEQSSLDTTATTNIAGERLNDGLRTKNDITDNSAMNLNVQWGHRFKKKSRNFIFNPSFNRSYNRQTGKLNAINTFFKTDNNTSTTDTIRQSNTSNDVSNALNLNVEFTEQVSKRIFLQTEYEYDLNWQEASIRINDLVEQQEFKVDSLSSNYSNRVGSQQLTLHTQYNASKWEISGIGGLQLSSVNSTNSNAAQLPIHQKYLNFIAGITSDYEISDDKRIGVYYWTIASQPNEAQLQPVPDRSDPLHVHYGNPNLRPEQSHSLSWSFNQFHPKKNYSFYINADLGFVQHKIMEIITIDERFVRHSRPENTPGAFSGGLSLNYSMPIQKTKGNYTLNFGTNTSKGQIYVNERLNTSTDNSINASFALNYRVQKWFRIRSSVRHSQNSVHYSIDQTLNQKFNAQQYSLSTTFRFPQKFTIESTYNLNVNRGRTQGFNRTIPIWNIEISRNFLKSEMLSVSISAHDLLNRNIGVTRSVSLNTIEDRKSVALSRYFLLTVNYMLRQI